MTLIDKIVIYLRNALEHEPVATSVSIGALISGVTLSFVGFLIGIIFSVIFMRVFSMVNNEVGRVKS